MARPIKTVLLLWLAFTGHAAMAEPIHFLAASSTTKALTEIAAAFRQDRQAGAEVRLIFASSSALARQIEARAPAASIPFGRCDAWMSYLADKGLIDRASRQILFSNQLVLAGPREFQSPPLDLALGQFGAGDRRAENWCLVIRPMSRSAGTPSRRSSNWAYGRCWRRRMAYASSARSRRQFD